MPAIFYQISALVAGILLSIQVGLNGKLRVAFGSPVVAAIVSFIVGFAFLIGALVVRRETFPSLKSLGGIPPQYFIGGLLGAIYVTMATVFFQKLGAIQTTGLVVAGQIVASMLIDHFGFWGVPIQPLSLTRLVAAGMLLGGVWLAGYQPK